MMVRVIRSGVVVRVDVWLLLAIDKTSLAWCNLKVANSLECHRRWRGDDSGRYRRGGKEQKRRQRDEEAG